MNIAAATHSYNFSLAAKYLCDLDAQPDHLTPAWLVGEQWRTPLSLELKRNPFAKFQNDIDLGEGMTPSSMYHDAWTLWVEDPATQVRCPYLLGPNSMAALEAWEKCGCNALEPNVWSGALNIASILTLPTYEETCLEDWRRTVNSCRLSLGNGFAPVRGLIHPFQISALRRYFRGLMRRNCIRFGDSQSSLRYVAHNEPVASFFHHQLSFAVGELLGKPVKPSYCYFICYQGGAELPLHADRAQCEYTLALCLDFSPEPRRETPWPLQLQLPDTTVVAYQALGDALLYEGRRIPHFRKRLADGCTSASILFHYVDRDFTGSLS